TKRGGMAASIGIAGGWRPIQCEWSAAHVGVNTIRPVPDRALTSGRGRPAAVVELMSGGRSRGRRSLPRSCLAGRGLMTMRHTLRMLAVAGPLFGSGLVPGLSPLTPAANSDFVLFARRHVLIIQL